MGKSLRSGVWYTAMKKLVPYMEKRGFDWLEKDSVHFEFHPKWDGAMSGDKLVSEKLKAIDEARKDGRNTENPMEWLQFWKNADACNDRGQNTGQFDLLIETPIWNEKWTGASPLAKIMD